MNKQNKPPQHQTQKSNQRIPERPRKSCLPCTLCTVLITRDVNSCHRDAKRQKSPTSLQHYSTTDKQKVSNNKYIRGESKELIHLLVVIHVLQWEEGALSRAVRTEYNADIWAPLLHVHYCLLVKHLRQHCLRCICLKEVTRNAISPHISVSHSISLGKISPETIYHNLISNLWQLLSLQLCFLSILMIKKDTVHSFLFPDFLQFFFFFLLKPAVCNEQLLPGAHCKVSMWWLCEWFTVFHVP